MATLHRIGGRSALFGNVAVAGAIAVLAAVLIYVTGDKAQWAAFGLGAYAVITWGQIQKYRDRPLYALTFGDPTFALATSSCALIACFAGAAGVWAAPYAMRTFHIPAHEIGLSLGLTHIAGSLLGVLFGGWLADRWRSRDLRAPMGMSAIALLGSAPCILVMVLVKDFQVFLGSIFLLGIFSAMWSPSTAAMVQDLVLPRMRGSAAAVLFAGRDRHLVGHRPLLGRQGQRADRLAHLGPAVDDCRLHRLALSADLALCARRSSRNPRRPACCAPPAAGETAEELSHERHDRRPLPADDSALRRGSRRPPRSRGDRATSSTVSAVMPQVHKAARAGAGAKGRLRELLGLPHHDRARPRPRSPALSVLTYEACEAAFRDPQVFSTRSRARQPGKRENNGHPRDGTRRCTVPIAARFQPKFLMPEAMGWWRQQTIDGIVQRLIARMGAKDRAELNLDFCARIQSTRLPRRSGSTGRGVRFRHAYLHSTSPEPQDDDGGPDQERPDRRGHAAGADQAPVGRAARRPHQLPAEDEADDAWRGPPAR
jgi:hypothetical protein